MKEGGKERNWKRQKGRKGRMDGWEDEWTDGWIDGQTDGWMDGGQIRNRILRNTEYMKKYNIL